MILLEIILLWVRIKVYNSRKCYILFFAEKPQEEQKMYEDLKEKIDHIMNQLDDLRGHL